MMRKKISAALIGMIMVISTIPSMAFAAADETRDSAYLSELKFSMSNLYDASLVGYSPEFDPQTTSYNTEVWSGGSIEDSDMINVWVTAQSKNAKVQVFPVSNVANEEVEDLEEDGSIDARQSLGHNRYPVFLFAGKTWAKVRIRVTSENKKVVKNYDATVHRDPAFSGVGLTLNRKNATLYTKGIGSTLDLRATLDNSEEAITWNSSSSKVATVEDGKISALSPGKANITANVSNAAATCKVTVKAPTLSLSKSKATLYTCKGYNTTSLSSAINGSKNQKASWKVAKGSKYVSVSSSGKITAKRSGTAIVSAAANGVKKTCTVYVKKPSFKLTKSSAKIKKNKKMKIAVKSVVPKGKVTFKSANSRIATVTSKGVVKGKRAGKTYIKVTCNKVTKKFVVYVR